MMDKLTENAINIASMRSFNYMHINKKILIEKNCKQYVKVFIHLIDFIIIKSIKCIEFLIE